MKFETKQAELLARRNWLLEVNAILKEQERGWFSRDSRIIIEGLNEQLIIIEKVYEDGDLRGFQDIISYYLEGLRDLTPDEVIKVDQRLREKSGIGLKTVQRAVQKKVREILKRGKVGTADEYRILQSRVEEIFDDPKKKEEHGKIVEVLSAVQGTLED